MARLQDRVAIISGAASGQGLAEAKLFLAEGAKVVLTDQDAARGIDAAAGLSGDARFVSHDVTFEDQWQDVVDQTLAWFGRVDILVNNAGIYRPATLEGTDRALMDAHYQVNVLGTFLGMQAVRSAMTRQGGGAIVNVASVAGLRGFPGVLAYASSKWMVRGLGKCAAMDLASSNIRVNTILPGLIDTPMLRSNPPEVLAAMAQQVPSERLGEAEDVARAALYLASDEASYVFGAELTVCGGMAA